MATLIKRKGSPYWFVAFDVPQPDGSIRRLKKSTKKKTQEEAMAEVPRILETERKLAVATDEENRTNYEILAEANRAASKGELSEARARELLSRMLQNATGKGLQNYTVRTWSAEWLRRKSPLKKATRNRYATSVRTFLAFLGAKAEKRLESVTKADVRRFRDEVRLGWQPTAIAQPGATKRKPKKPRIKPEQPPPRTAKTTNQYAADIAGMFKEAVIEGLLLANPTAGLERLPENDSVEREPFETEEVKILFEKAGEPEWHSLIFSQKATKPRPRLNRCEDWPGMVLFGYYVGTRIGDIAQLRWTNVNLDRGTASFLPKKTQANLKYYEVPLHPSLVGWLASRDIPKDLHEPIFPNLFKTSTSGNTGLSSQFSAIMEYAKIDRRLIRPAANGMRALYARGFHSLRHTSNSALANANVPQEMRMKIIGHQSHEVNQIYTRLELETLRTQVDKLPAI